MEAVAVDPELLALPGDLIDADGGGVYEASRRIE